MPPIASLLRRPVTRDAGLALVLSAATVLLGASVFLPNPGATKMITRFGSATAWHQHIAWWWLAAALAVMGLLLRGRWPLLAFGLASVSAGAHLLDTDIPLLPIDVAVALTLYTVASQARSRRRSAAILATALTVLYALCIAATLPLGQPSAGDKQAALLASPWRSGLVVVALSTAAIPALLLGIAWVTGDNARTRRRYLTALEARADDLRRDQDQRAALAVAAERARITRELHDIVAHGISVMVVQAQGAAAALRRHPDRAAGALTTVIDTGRASLTEMRRLLDLTRRDPTGAAQLAPHPGVGTLPALIDQLRDTGLTIDLHIRGQAIPLPAGVDLSAFRIVQEALTNTLKHAGASAAATVQLAFTDTELAIDVTDTGATTPAVPRTTAAPTPPATTGNGLRGIEERVAALGGALHAGPCDNGGFAIRARIPIPATP